MAALGAAIGAERPARLDLDERAITRGRELLHEWLEEVPHAV